MQLSPLINQRAAALLLEQRFAERLTGRRTNDLDIIIPASREMQVDADRQFCDRILAVAAEAVSGTRPKPN